MPENSLLTEDIKRKIGQPLTKPLVYTVQKRDIERFIEAVEDFNPLWQDEGFAQSTEHGRIVAPPIFVNSLRPPEYMANILSIGEERLGDPLALGTEYEFFHPVHVNDTITVTTKLVEAREQETRRGKMLILVGEKIYTNQKEELVGIERSSVSKFPRS
jgi:acyl dehydratase